MEEFHGQFKIGGEKKKKRSAPRLEGKRKKEEEEEEVPVQSQNSNWSCICVLVVSILSLSTILIFDTGIVPICAYPYDHRDFELIYNVQLPNVNKKSTGDIKK